MRKPFNNKRWIFRYRMEQFLQFCHFNLPNITNFKKIHLIVGNESCDLDSVVSAIVLAYIKYHELTTSSAENDAANVLNDDNDDEDSEVIVLPVLNVFREDLHLRPEIVFWFEKVLQFDLKWLICRDEIDFDAINSSSTTAQIFLSLVDHNEDKEFQRLLPRCQLDEIIDHHQPLQEIKCDPAKVQIDTSVGSCCSLIALRYFRSNITRHKFGPSNTSSETFDSQIALILYGPILLDTACFSSQAKRFNAKDYEAINKLEDLLKHPADVEPSLYDRNEVYQRLIAAKSSIDGLSFDDLLRKDMKIVESNTDNNLSICISSITGILLTEMSLRDKLKELKNFCDNPPKTAVFSESHPRLFSAIILMSLDNRIPNNLRRQLAIYSPNKHLMRTIATRIERSELELELITALESLRIYNQNNLTASRKVVLPMISTILNGPGRQNSTESNGAAAGGEKRNEMITNGSSGGVGGSEMLSSAPSSFIQQPDSYYGSFIDDSFVGDFVGDYPGAHDDDHEHHENILVMDADGQNLVMMNPAENTCISHEIEFDFDSFGPESIIYSGSTTNVTDSKKDLEKSDKSNKSNDEGVINGDNIESSVPNGDQPREEDGVVVEEEYHNETLKMDQSEQSDDKNEQSKPVMDQSDSVENNQQQQQNNPDLESNNTDVQMQQQQQQQNQSNSEMNTSSSSSSLLLTNNNKDSFNRNNTLSRSQRKKIVPQLHIKNLVLNDDTFSPPTLEQISTPPLVANVTTLNNNNNNSNNNLLYNENNHHNDSSSSSQLNHSITTTTTTTTTNTTHLMNDPLGVISSNNNINSLNDTINNSNNLGGLTRQPSMKKKVEVNYTMFLNPIDIDVDGGGGENKNPTAIIDSSGGNTIMPIDSSGSSNSQQQQQQQQFNNNTNHSNFSGGNAATANNIPVNFKDPADPYENVDDPNDDHWKPSLGNIEIRTIDLKVIEPYKKVISHGGHLRPTTSNGGGGGGGTNNSTSSQQPVMEGTTPAIIVFAACYLPDRSQPNYNYVMDNLFLYVVSTLHNMVADDYILIYLHNNSSSQGNTANNNNNNMPTFSWLKRCYQMIDRKLKKNLKGLYLIHPTFWLKTLIIMSKPFISSKFSRKLKFVRSLDELKQLIPIDDLEIPEPVKM